MNRDEICAEFLDRLTFDLYPWQEEALLSWFENGENDGVMVCVPTGMGKTLIAEAALYEALKSGRRMYYTTPLIALTDQKFREFQDKAESWGFPRDHIGLVTGNRQENPNAVVLVVVAEILLNHLLASARDPQLIADVDAVVMDEFHSFNDPERGIVWELSLVLLPKKVRVLLLSATVGNPREFSVWLHQQHGRKLRVLLTDERRVPLEFIWVEDKLLTEHLPAMVARNDADNRTPALVFCFNRDECWDLAERLKGLALADEASRKEITAYLDERIEDFQKGVGPKLRQMLARGVGVHHAGVLPRHKLAVEELFLRKLVPFVVCTETLAAGINLPARSVVMTTLIKGRRGDKKLVPAASAHQIFGRAGRPQFDDKGYVYAVAHEDDARIMRWREKYDRLDPKSKDPNILRARKDLERKKPSRRKTEQYWSAGQFEQLRNAGSAKLLSRGMIPYQVLIYLLRRDGSVRDVRAFLSQRFNEKGVLDKFQEQLDFMLNNMAGLGYIQREEGSDEVTVLPEIERLSAFRSIDPMFGDFLSRLLPGAEYHEKILALEGLLEVPPSILRKIAIPDDLPKGVLQRDLLEPMMITLGVKIAGSGTDDDEDGDEDDHWAEPVDERPPQFPDMLRIAFESKLVAPEPINVQAKWIAGSMFEFENDFYKCMSAHNLIKQEGLILRHLLRLTILSGEFMRLTQDPDFGRIADQCSSCCRSVDPVYTDTFLAEAEAARESADI